MSKQRYTLDENDELVPVASGDMTRQQGMQMGLGQSQAPDMSRMPAAQSMQGPGPAAGPPLPNAPNMMNYGGGLMSPQQSSVGGPPPGPAPQDISGGGMGQMPAPSMGGLMAAVNQGQRQQQPRGTPGEFKMNDYLRGLMYG